MKVIMTFSVLLLFLITWSTLADQDPITINGPDDMEIEQDSTGLIIWNISSGNPESWWVLQNGTKVVEPTKYNHEKNITVPIKTTELGCWNYTIFANDTLGNITTDQVNVIIFDNTSPIISKPIDRDIEQGNEGNITWTITEKNPNKYWVLRNGVKLDLPEKYDDGIPVQVSINTSVLGIWNYTIFASDNSSNEATDRVNITVVDMTAPIISGPEDQDIQQFSPGNIIWNIIEKNPDKFWVFWNNSNYVIPTDYENNSYINVGINTSSLGRSTYTIFANDTNGIISLDTVTIDVHSSMDSFMPIIKGPDDQIIEHGIKLNLTWTIIEEYPATYVIKRNGELIDAGGYINNSSISPLDVILSVGIYNYTIEASDSSENKANDSVYITVHERAPPILTGPADHSVYKDIPANIIWNLEDLSPGQYWIKLKGSLINSPAPFQDNDVITVPIDTTSVGLWNYTIFANDTFGDISTHQVNITVKVKTTYGSGSSGSGGGGGGASGESFNNILLSETEREYTGIGTRVTYIFDQTGDIIKSASFTSLTNSGKIAAKLEILKSTSSLVTVNPPHTVYKNFNLYVGNMGWFSRKNIKDPSITFSVEKSWVEQHNIKVDSINLYRFDDSSWILIPTEYIPDNSPSYSFKAKPLAGPLGQMAISGQTEILHLKPKTTIKPTSKPSITTRNPDPPPLNIVPIATPVTWTNLWKEKVPGFKASTLLFALIVLYLFDRWRD